ncbi:hypothetical protein K503DRAFT_788374, partial [Rhizopogon vinicolor AM-OR11-026]
MMQWSMWNLADCGPTYCKNLALAFLDHVISASPPQAQGTSKRFVLIPIYAERLKLAPSVPEYSLAHVATNITWWTKWRQENVVVKEEAAPESLQRIAARYRSREATRWQQQPPSPFFN